MNRNEVLVVAAELMTPQASSFAKELLNASKYGINEADLDAPLFVPQTAAYVRLAEKLIEAVDRWEARQPQSDRPPPTIALSRDG